MGLVIAPFLAWLFVLSALPAAVPLVLREQAKACARACLVIGTGLLTWALIGAVIGMFLFIPAALLLLVAAFADAGSRPGGWFAVTAPLATVAVFALIVLAPDPENEPPPYFKATLDSTQRFHDREFNERKEHLRDFGATSIEVSEEYTGRLELHVGMPRDFSEGRSRDRLKEEIARLPGVVEVDFCTYRTCDY
ncbi:hypothetical protein [Streptomyces abyssomicinicus]|uniref:hypothetical protein n=1 Tax=Streptomyces abyssomicinicus TaxID=574929 RepID=UPI00124F89B9|nr:hypothetical protein [Streptomyces abyssomicinicus]